MFKESGHVYRSSIIVYVYIYIVVIVVGYGQYWEHFRENTTT